jgi:hypothetical protein
MYKSKQYKNIMAAVAMIESLLLEMKEGEKYDWYDELIVKIEEGLEYCEEIYHSIPKLLSKKDIKRFSQNINVLNEKFFFPHTDLLVMFSFITLLLEEPASKIKNEKLSILMNQLGYLIADIHSYFENRDTDVYEAIKYGDQAFQFWKILDW